MNDRLGIDTPESVRFTFEVADLGARALGAFVDGLIRFVTLMLVITGMPLFGFTFRFTVPIVVTVFVLQWVYFTAFELAWHGQTPGKRVAGIRVIRNGGYPLGFLGAMVRNLVRVIDMLPGPYGIGLTVAFLDPKRRRLGDLVAGTLVVRVREPALASFARRGSPPPPGAAWARWLAGIQLDGIDRELIHGYLDRRGGLEPEARLRVRAELVESAIARLQDPETREALVSALPAHEQDAFLDAVIGWDRE